MALFAGNSYYDQSKFTPVYYVAFMELERYIARELFKNDLTRIFYSAADFAFRQRLNLLAKTSTSDVQDFQFPFACYTRATNWELDTRIGVNSGIAYGGPNIGMDIAISDSIVIPNCRFMQTTSDFSLTFFFNTDIDMQIAYETLLWIKRLTPKQWTTDSLEYAGARVGIPIVLQINSVSVNSAAYNEAEWLRQQRVFPIDVQLTVKTMVFDQVAQGASSTLFKTTEQSAGPALYIAKEVIYDFLTYKGDDPFMSENNVELIVTGTFNPDPSVSITLDATDVTDTTATLEWEITVTDEDPDYVATANIILNTDPENTIIVPADDEEYSLTNLSPASTYTAKVMFETTVHTFVTKYVSFTTTGEADTIKGIIGLKF
jgi:hypothetical protein